MYHGDVVPGFPQHPHRGFETVTLVRRGFVDHADSLGATARFGQGDAQWLTAGSGIVHSEMFPLLDPAGNNPLDLFQIWLNLPAVDKRAPPHFAMLWSHAIPTCTSLDASGRATRVTMVAGRLGDTEAPPPPPRSWAARKDSDVAIWALHVAPQAAWTLPPAAKGTNRTLYFFRGGSIAIGNHALTSAAAVVLCADAEVTLVGGSEASELLLLQGRPIGEPVMQHRPFVMNTRAELQQAFTDYQRTRFGGWPFPSSGPVHPRNAGRFARHADGLVERPGKQV